MRPGEAGVFRLETAFAHWWIAAIPFPNGDWWEGPRRDNAPQALEDLRAEESLRSWLRDRRSDALAS